MFRSNRLPWRKPPAIWGHGIAVLSVTAAVFISRWLAFHLETAPALLFLCAVLISAWLGGVGPGLLATGGRHTKSRRSARGTRFHFTLPTKIEAHE
jgi:hypothetical protein